VENQDVTVAEVWGGGKGSGGPLAFESKGESQARTGRALSPTGHRGQPQPNGGKNHEKTGWTVYWNVAGKCRGIRKIPSVNFGQPGEGKTIRGFEHWY